MRWSEAGYLSQFVLAHALRQASVSLILGVRQKKMNPDPIYLDTSFIVDAFEEWTGTDAPASITRTRDITSELSAGIFSAGASSSESKEFPFGAAKMYAQVLAHLKRFDVVELAKAKPAELPEFFWTDGILGASGSSSIIQKRIVRHQPYFRLYSDLENYTAKYVLLVNDTYFSAGYDQVGRHLEGCCQGFGIEVHGLFRLLAIDPVDSPICAPMVMMKKRNV
jgi:hypothetical protein